MAAAQEDAQPADSDPRIWAISDVHTDKKDNKAWLTSLEAASYGHDVLILAGDISNVWEQIVDTLKECKQRFGRVFFCAGNHDLWTRGQKVDVDSMARLRRIQDACKEMGVETEPATVTSGGKRILIIPLLSWHHPQWDTEPELDCWKGNRRVQETVNDYMLTSWPSPLKQEDGSVARAIDSMNDDIFDMARIAKDRSGYDAVISFSHFVPCPQVNPEKRYFIPPCLVKAVGSTYLKNRIEKLKPDVHVFGHTHYGYDLTVNGIRYIQAPLATPGERSGGGSLVALGDFPVVSPAPCLIWDPEAGWPCKYRSSWSDYYTRYGRCPDVTNIVPSVVAEMGGLTPGSDKCKAGWVAGRMPIWMFGPLQHRLLEAEQSKQQVRDTLAAEGDVHRKSQSKDGPVHSEPQLVTVNELKAMLKEKRPCAIIDVRVDAEHPKGRKRIAGSIPLPHPAKTETFVGLGDEELLELCERLMVAGNGPGCMVLYGEKFAVKECREAALLLAAYFRLWPKDVLMLKGGLQAWLVTKGDVDEIPPEQLHTEHPV